MSHAMILTVVTELKAMGTCHAK